MVKNKKNIKIDKSLVLLIIVFLALFFLKALLYGLFGHDVWVFIAKSLSFIPENILLYAFLPIFYIFMLPMQLVLSNLSFLNSSNNLFIRFSLDIALTIIYLTILFFLVKSIFHYFKKRYLIVGTVVLVCFIILGLTSYYLIRKQSQSLSSPITPTADKINNWKTYANYSLGLSFKYPQNWIDPTVRPQSTHTEISFDPIDANNLSLIIGFDYNQTTGKNITYSETISSATANLKSQEDFLLDGIKGKKITYTMGASTLDILYIVPMPNESANILKIQYTIPRGDPDTSKLFDQILSTFKFINDSENMMIVKLYYHNPKLDPNMEFCESRDYIEKEIPKTDSHIKDAINTLIRSDIFEKNDTFILKSINLKQDGTLVLKFPFIGGFTTGGSCRIGIITSQIKKTALQFPEVKKVIFEPEVFQP